MTNYIPVVLKEEHWEAIWPWGFKGLYSKHYLFNLISKGYSTKLQIILVNYTRLYETLKILRKLKMARIV